MKEFIGRFTWLDDRLLLDVVLLLLLLLVVLEQFVVVEPVLLIVEKSELELEHSDGAISELTADETDEDSDDDDDDDEDDDDDVHVAGVAGIDDNVVVVVNVGDDAVAVVDIDIGSGWQLGSNRSEPIELPSRTANMRCLEVNYLLNRCFVIESRNRTE